MSSTESYTHKYVRNKKTCLSHIKHIDQNLNDSHQSCNAYCSKRSTIILQAATIQNTKDSVQHVFTSNSVSITKIFTYELLFTDTNYVTARKYFVFCTNVCEMDHISLSVKWIIFLFYNIQLIHFHFIT